MTTWINPSMSSFNIFIGTFNSWLLPHVAGVLPEVLIDVLYILKRCLTSFGRVVQGGRSSSTLGEHSLTSPSSSSPSLSSYVVGKK